MPQSWHRSRSEDAGFACIQSADHLVAQKLIGKVQKVGHVDVVVGSVFIKEMIDLLELRQNSPGELVNLW